MTVGSDPRHLADEVARAARWSGHLPRAERRTALRLWLANRLAGQPREAVRQTIEELEKLFAPVPEAKSEPESAPEPELIEDETATPELAVSLPVQLLVEFAQKYYGPGWEPSGTAQADYDAALNALKEIESKIRAAAPSNAGPGAGIGALLEALSSRVAATDGALRKAAQESFARLLESLSPVTLEAQAGRRGVKVGPFYKASLYDAWCEKFETIKTYHDSGLLVGDFRSAFKRYLRESEEQERRE